MPNPRGGIRQNLKVWYVDVKTMMDIPMVITSSVKEDYLRLSHHILLRYVGGDRTMIAEIEHNAASDAPLHVMAREALDGGSLLSNNAAGDMNNNADATVNNNTNDNNHSNDNNASDEESINEESNDEGKDKKDSRKRILETDDAAMLKRIATTRLDTHADPMDHMLQAGAKATLIAQTMGPTAGEAFLMMQLRAQATFLSRSTGASGDAIYEEAMSGGARPYNKSPPASAEPASQVPPQQAPSASVFMQPAHAAQPAYGGLAPTPYGYIAVPTGFVPYGGFSKQQPLHAIPHGSVNDGPADPETEITISDMVTETLGIGGVTPSEFGAVARHVWKQYVTKYKTGMRKHEGKKDIYPKEHSAAIKDFVVRASREIDYSACRRRRY